MQLLFSFDQDMTVEKTLLSTLSCLSGQLLLNSSLTRTRKLRLLSSLLLDTHADLLDWTVKIMNSIKSAVETVKVKVYPGSWKGTRVRLHLDIEEGLKLYTGDDKVIDCLCFCWNGVRFGREFGFGYSSMTYIHYIYLFISVEPQYS